MKKRGLKKLDLDDLAGRLTPDDLVEVARRMGGKKRRRSAVPKKRRSLLPRRCSGLQGKSPRDKALRLWEIEAVGRDLERRYIEAVERFKSDGRASVVASLSIWLMWRFVALTALRYNEAATIRVTDELFRVDTTDDGRRFIKVWAARGKGSFPSWVTIPPGDLSDRIIAHAMRFDSTGGTLADLDTGRVLFCSRSRKPLWSSRVSRVLTGEPGKRKGCAFDMAGVDLGARQTWHGLRHHAAWREWERTGDLRAVQALLGHRNIQTTYHYLGLDKSEREEMIATSLGELGDKY